MISFIAILMLPCFYNDLYRSLCPRCAFFLLMFVLFFSSFDFVLSSLKMISLRHLVFACSCRLSHITTVGPSCFHQKNRSPRPADWKKGGAKRKEGLQFFCSCSHDLSYKRVSVGQSEGRLIHRSSVWFRLKPENFISYGLELHRPSIKGTKLLLKVTKAIIIISCRIVVISACSWPSQHSWFFRKFHPLPEIVHPRPGSKHVIRPSIVMTQKVLVSSTCSSHTCNDPKILTKPPSVICWSRNLFFPISGGVSFSRRRPGSYAAVGIEGASHRHDSTHELRTFLVNWIADSDNEWMVC